MLKSKRRKPKARTSRKSSKASKSRVQAMPPETRVALQKANVARVRRLTQQASEHGRIGRQFAALMGVSDKQIPASLRRDMEVSRRKASVAKRPRLARLRPTDPKPTGEREA